MKKYFKSLLLVLMANVCIITAQAQDTAANASTDVMRSNGKIYVVMAVVATIVTGLFIYVYSIDKKISKLENK
jgi:heme/copper-type cytochrome/quinol oxidase subunit 2